MYGFDRLFWRRALPPVAQHPQGLPHREESLALLRTILTAVPRGIGYVDADSRYLSVTAASFAEVGGPLALVRTTRELSSMRRPVGPNESH